MTDDLRQKAREIARREVQSDFGRRFVTEKAFEQAILEGMRAALMWAHTQWYVGNNSLEECIRLALDELNSVEEKGGEHGV